MNAFALLGLPEKPGLNSEQVDRAFRALAGTHHPDKPGGDSDLFAALVEARQILSTTSLRLRHLVELKFPGKSLPAPSLPANPELGFAVSTVAAKCARLAASQIPTSPIARASLATELAAARTELSHVVGKVNDATNLAHTRLDALDAHWPPSNAAPIAKLATEFTFLENWQSQLESTRLQLLSLTRTLRGEPEWSAGAKKPKDLQES